jgi:hypothetical protein
VICSDNKTTYAIKEKIPDNYRAFKTNRSSNCVTFTDGFNRSFSYNNIGKCVNKDSDHIVKKIGQPVKDGHKLIGFWHYDSNSTNFLIALFGNKYNTKVLYSIQNITKVSFPTISALLNLIMIQFSGVFTFNCIWFSDNTKRTEIMWNEWEYLCNNIYTSECHLFLCPFHPSIDIFISSIHWM